jgi:hypothetical protein
LTQFPSHSAAIEPDDADRSILRLGLLIDDFVQPAWIESCLQEVARRGDARVALIVRNSRPMSATPQRSRVAAWWKNRRFLAHALYSRIDSTRSVARDPFEPRDTAPLLASVPVLDVTPRETRYSDYFEDEDLAKIRTYDLDVAVRFGFRILRGGALRIARHGVWSYHHGDNNHYRGGPAGFWEVMFGDPVTGFVLQQLGEDLDGGRILFRGWCHSIPFSVRRNRAHYYWQASPFLAWKLRDLRQYGPSALPADAEQSDAPATYSRRVFTIPRNGEMLDHGVRLTGRYLRQRSVAMMTTEQWYLAYRQAPDMGDHAPTPDLNPSRFHPLIPPTDRFWADPFPYRAEGKTWVFFEEFIHGSQRPHIAVMEFGPQGPNGPARPALAADTHLSYPFIFEFDGQTYMMPETANTGRVQLWRAEKLPSQWVPDRVLLEGLPLVDATMACVDGQWWLWASATTSLGISWDELHLYHAESPLGPWKAHPRNPVIVDVRNTRPAGRPFVHKGAWYRPAQDCSVSYGGAMVIQRIDRLDSREYHEHTVARLDPSWAKGLVGTHTINAAAGLTVIDVRRRHWRWVR